MKHLPHSENKMATMIWKSIAIVFVSFLFSPTLSAQDIIFEHSYEPSEFSTIRNYTENVDIKYEIRISPGYHKRFSYIDRSSGTVMTFNIDDYWSVSDFRIMDGYVYFCGKDNGVAAFGWFNIDSVFFYNGNVHVMTLPSVVPYAQQQFNDVTITIFDRLALARIGGIVHLYMIGQAYSDNYSGDVIADAWLYPPSGWILEYSVEYENLLDYQDLTTTNSDLVVVGTLSLSNIHYEQFIQYYTKQTSADANKSIFGIVMTPSYTNTNLHIVPYTIYEQKTRTTIVHTNGTSFVTIGEDTYTDEGIIVVSRFNTPTTPPIDRFIFKNIDRNSLREATMDRKNGVLGLVMRGSAGYIYEIDYVTGMVFRIGIEHMLWNSITRNEKSSQFIISGSKIDFSSEMIWQRTPLINNNCIYKNNVFPSQISPEMYSRNNRKYIERTNTIHNIYPVKVNNSPLEIICE